LLNKHFGLPLARFATEERLAPAACQWLLNGDVVRSDDMSDRGKKGKRKGGYLRPYVQGSWVAVEDDMLLSIAFSSIKPSSVVLLIQMLRIDKMLAYKHGDSYTSKFNLTYSEAETLGLARGTTKRAFDDLEKWGFIRKVVKGGLKSSGNVSSVYQIVDDWRLRGGLQSLKELEKLKRCGKQGL
jgi:hypothetical protein